MKQFFCTAVGVGGSAIINFIGGWDLTIQTLVFFMVVDYISGLIVAGVFKRSGKQKMERWRAMQGLRAFAKRAWCCWSCWWCIGWIYYWT